MSEFLDKVNAELVECQNKLSDEESKSPSDVLKWSFVDDSMKYIKHESKAAQELRCG